MMMKVTCSEITNYLDIARKKKYAVCKEQLALCDYTEHCFEAEQLKVNTDQLTRYLKNQRFFPYSLFPWEKFIFALHNCVYRQDGLLRWPVLFCMVGRGAGKTGYMTFEEHCWITPVNGVKNYDVDIFATSEKQAKTSFTDEWEMLEDNETKLGRYFYWTKEEIKNRKTGSTISYHTASPKTKDGARPGAVVFDEYHGYPDYKLINVAKTGLGKKQYPRQTIMTTDGYIRGGPLDDMKDRAHRILFENEPDNGLLPFICKLDDIKEIDDENCWYKANPSLQYFPDLLQELRQEYAEYKQRPTQSSSFVVKRMNIPAVDGEDSVTTWDNIQACKQAVPDLTGCECVAGIDYMKTTDFLSAGLLFKHKGIYYWLQHSWVCRVSPDLPRIKAPLHDWEEAGYLTFCDGPEISPNVPAQWLQEQAQHYCITYLGIDNFRYTLLTRALNEAGFDTDKGGANNIRLCKRVTENRYVPVITSLFNTHSIAWGDDPMMAWYTNNACIIEERGNQYYGKKEEKSRKTDGFTAMVAAICASADLQDSGESADLTQFGIMTF